MKLKRTLIVLAIPALAVLCACGARRSPQADAQALRDALTESGAHHAAFIAADGDGLFRPDDEMTRGEAAQLLWSLTGEQADGTGGVYSDVAGSDACSGAVEALTAAGVLSGYPDGSFRPDDPVTRGEYTALLCRALGLSGEGSPFLDVTDDDWAAPYIAAACGAGWITGYPDGTFRPGAALTRAEAVVILDRVLGRQADPELATVETGCAVFGDLSASHWAYAALLEAAVDHDCARRADGSESWSRYRIPVVGPGAGAQLIRGKLCYADPDTHELYWFSQGFNTVGGELFYASHAGYAADRFPQGTVEFQGSLYCVQEDGSFLTDGNWGHLYFDENGRYTSGDAELDGMVDGLLADILADGSTTREEKLYAAYCLIRDGGYKYAARGDLYDRGTTDWAVDCAKKMYETQKGTCYYFTAAFLFLARRVGYDAYPVVGGLWSNDVDHSWVTIVGADGKEYVCDVEMEWAYLHGYYSDTPKSYDLFMQPVGKTLFIYNFPD